MAISEAAQRNHDLLFPHHVSTLKDTDPELVELFDNWAFDEVLRDQTLDVRTRVMVQLAALIASQAVGEYAQRAPRHRRGDAALKEDEPRGSRGDAGSCR